MELICGHESLLALSNRGALPILDASFWRARSSYLLSGRPWTTVRMKQTALGAIVCLLWSDWNGEGESDRNSGGWRPKKGFRVLQLT